tara:strand:- start:114 stop:383 length:270 start_codon:yes stop_codon:yes gene_type:complete
MLLVFPFACWHALPDGITEKYTRRDEHEKSPITLSILGAAALMSGWAQATILTFDIPQLSNFQNANVLSKPWITPSWAARLPSFILGLG